MVKKDPHVLVKVITCNEKFDLNILKAPNIGPDEKIGTKEFYMYISSKSIIDSGFVNVGQLQF